MQCSRAPLFLNRLFQSCRPQFGDDFTAYIVFLSQLISMPEDVTLLAQRQIIVHHLDSDDSVSDLFTMLSKDIARPWKLTIIISSAGGWYGCG
jgi:hypothetical protein